MYRDAANYKQHGSVVVANPAGHSPEAVREGLRRRFAADQLEPDIVHFQPEALGWPTLYFEDHDETGDDLNLHELDAITPTDAPVTEEFDLDSLVNPR